MINICWAPLCIRPARDTAQDVTVEQKEKLQTEWESVLSPLSRPLPQPVADGWHPLCLGWNSTSVGAICTSPYQVLGPLGGHFKCLLGLRETSERLVIARLEIFWTRETEPRISWILEKGPCFCQFVSMKESKGCHEDNCPSVWPSARHHALASVNANP